MSARLDPIAGVILAGGLGRRFGGADKALIDFHGRPLLAHVVDRLAPQVDSLLLSANGDPTRFAAFTLPVLPDPVADAPGPLAGLAAAALHLGRRRPDVARLLTVAVDLPLLPPTLVADLAAALDAAPRARVAVARSGGRVHPVVALHRLDGLDDLVAGLASGAVRRVMTWVEARGMVEVDFSTADGDPFANLNSPDDLAALAAATLPRGTPP